jgi:hypothetical protein
MSLGERRDPSGLSLFALDPLHQEKTAMGTPTPLADFFSILLRPCSKAAKEPAAGVLTTTERREAHGIKTDMFLRLGAG